ncbi:GIY-YIG nuclease family protein [Chitinophaga silvatica]|uniref:GIY-YIG nuclease family protein n=2 Tax=Chitinophaga silvatica TaxID=2282649 RepID=A0A3E1YAS3_9BACT|nr:GIY-YIG nuclease family protein [Chitinophaga silvatica]
MPGLIKIGCTARSPEERRRELSRPTGIPGDFEIEYEIYSIEMYILEKRIHIELDKYRVSKSKEFFKIDISDAIHILRIKSEELLYEFTSKSEGVNELFDRYEAIEILVKLNSLYPNMIRSEIRSVRIYQTRIRCYLETTEENILSAGYFSVPLADQKIHRLDLAFIVDTPDDPVQEDPLLFNPSNPVSMNARLFIEELDPFSIYMCTDLFTEEAGKVINRDFNPINKKN